MDMASQSRWWGSCRRQCCPPFSCTWRDHVLDVSQHFLGTLSRTSPKKMGVKLVECRDDTRLLIIVTLWIVSCKTPQSVNNVNTNWTRNCVKLTRCFFFCFFFGIVINICLQVWCRKRLGKFNVHCYMFNYLWLAKSVRPSGQVPNIMTLQMRPPACAKYSYRTQNPL